MSLAALQAGRLAVWINPLFAVQAAVNYLYIYVGPAGFVERDPQLLYCKHKQAIVELYV